MGGQTFSAIDSGKGAARGESELTELVPLLAEAPRRDQPQAALAAEAAIALLWPRPLPAAVSVVRSGLI